VTGSDEGPAEDGSSLTMSSRASSSEREFKDAILTSALQHVPEVGWSLEALRRGAIENGYPPTAHGAFPHGAASLVEEHIIRCNDELCLELDSAPLDSLRTPDRIRYAVETRLRMHVRFIDQWPQAVALLAEPQNAPRALKLLALMVDDIWQYCGDTTATSDINWYTKRAMLTGVYTATEVYMMQYKSEDFRDTWEFLDRRLSDVAALGKSTAGLKELSPIAASIFATLKNVAGAPGPRY